MAVQAKSKQTHAAKLSRKGWLLVAEPPVSNAPVDVETWMRKDREERDAKLLAGLSRAARS